MGSALRDYVAAHAELAAQEELLEHVHLTSPLDESAGPGRAPNGLSVTIRSLLPDAPAETGSVARHRRTGFLAGLSGTRTGFVEPGEMPCPSHATSAMIGERCLALASPPKSAQLASGTLR
jgi:hypothetical protein